MAMVCDNLLCCGSKRHGLTLFALIYTRVRLVCGSLPSLTLSHKVALTCGPHTTLGNGALRWNLPGSNPRATNPPHLSVSWSPLLFLVAPQCWTSSAWQAIHVLYLELAICAGLCMRSSPTYTTFCDFTLAPHGQETLPGLDSRRGTGLSIMGSAPSPFNVAGEGSEIFDRAQTQNERISADQILPISISTPTPSEHRSDDPTPLRMRMMRPPASTRVARPQNHGQTARSTHGPKSTVQSPAKCAHRRGFEAHWVRKGPRDHPGKSMPRATGEAVRCIDDLLWCRGREKQWNAVAVVECTLQN
ncbi:hypothetical protein BDQ94DRAFT_164578 [Aspergillus welwitschiae]|uniref:Uncharacterized protein n=1 Tax=Aspergillus welwitschiae TaxID=1341132 RepID=A0A3F3PH96_9EURO|nr:hypothetical protein BDQ94DRAFT_164578 [Aspergillus welwitschiae]RDH26325.1 hypothetical protein BDQ94DRAFT_164578 [Aspergillus welwitschiae]